MDNVLLAFRFRVHRVVLFVASKFFKALFGSQLKVYGEQEASVDGVDCEALEQLIEYAYTGEITITSANVEKLTMAATKLEFAEVKENCGEFYFNMLTVSNCWRIGAIAEIYGMLQLKEAVHAFNLDHFVELSQCDEFLHLDIDRLTILLKADELNVTSEEDVLNALMVWVKFDVESRKPSFELLLDTIRFKHINDSVSECFQPPRILSTYINVPKF